MNVFEELIGRLRVLLPDATFNNDDCSIPGASHWLAIRVGHALVITIWHPGKYFKVSTETDIGLAGTEEVVFDEDCHQVIDYIVNHVIERGLA